MGGGKGKFFTEKGKVAPSGSPRLEKIKGDAEGEEGKERRSGRKRSKWGEKMKKRGKFHKKKL